MELIKRNIHMDRLKTQAVTQFTMEDDVNIPDSKPDVSTLNLEKGELVVEEIKPGNDVVNVRGYLDYAVLYHTMEEGSSLVVMEGKLPFDERIHLTGVVPGDSVSVSGEVEDLTVGMINSRKLNIQSLITMLAKVEELYDEEVPVGINGEEKAEYRQMPLELTQIAVCKNDIFRIKEEISLPSNYPNIYRLLWDNVSMRDVEFKIVGDKIAFSGDVHLFLLYEGEGEEHPVRSFESTIPVSGAIECSGCREGMVPDVRYRMGQKELAVRPDFDGEERCVGMELVLDFEVRVYEEEKLDVISDIYGVTKEIAAVTDKADLCKLLSRVTGKTKVTDHVHVKAGNVLQLLHSEGSIVLEQQTIVENGILLQGSLTVKMMYITGEDDAPYSCAQAQIPYEYTLEVPDIRKGDTDTVHAEVEQLQVTMLDGEEMDVKAVVCFSTVVFRRMPTELIREISVQPLNMEKMSNLPSMVVYMVKPGDNLWNIGKKYYTPVELLRSLNSLENDELKEGQKLLIVKGS